MIKLEFFDGSNWIFVSEWESELFAWLSLGDDNVGYRTVDENGKVLTDKSIGFD